jgi:hypothetical protein
MTPARKRGRPRKPKAPKGPRGAPAKRLCDADDRYTLAVIQGNIDAAARFGISERRVVETCSTLLYGAVANAPENVASFVHGRKFAMTFRQEAFPVMGALGSGGDWRNKSAFRPYADGIRNKLRKIRQLPRDADDRRWLGAMSQAWTICLRGDMRLRDHAEALAIIVGERDYFRSVMLPALYGTVAGSRDWKRIFRYLNTHPEPRNM